jgi:uncharacterized protein
VDYLADMPAPTELPVQRSAWRCTSRAAWGRRARSAEGELRTYYDTITAYQNRLMRPNLQKVVNFEMLSLWGDIDPDITFEFEPLLEMTEKERAEIQKMKAETRQVYVDMGAFAPAEVRGVVVDDPDEPFTDLNAEDVPDLREEEIEGLIVPDGGRAESTLLEMKEGEQ